MCNTSPLPPVPIHSTFVCCFTALFIIFTTHLHSLFPGLPQVYSSVHIHNNNTEVKERRKAFYHCSSASVYDFERKWKVKTGETLKQGNVPALVELSLFSQLQQHGQPPEDLASDSVSSIKSSLYMQWMMVDILVEIILKYNNTRTALQIKYQCHLVTKVCGFGEVYYATYIHVVQLLTSPIFGSASIVSTPTTT